MGEAHTEERQVVRQQDAKPVLDELEVWLQTQLPKISNKFPLAKAIRYALTRLPKVRPYLDNGFLEIDMSYNLTSESDWGGLRPFKAALKKVVKTLG
ncbi:IS66 family transposase [Flexibacterium corallicola]|uniref:IS66 family transposase n=1 Tax=Flexibacterium corallicola TaxID=3037259 RepID=UPI00286F26E4|nr:transposase [Pseudovibrio sp. M1P-2-3]